jgi:hypothetical protein
MTRIAIDSPDLLAWLDAHTCDRASLADTPVVRLPVAITVRSIYVDTAHVGALAIRVDDSTLALPIAAKLPMLCGEGVTRGTLIVRGLWRGGGELLVREVEGAATPGDSYAEAYRQSSA